MCDIAIFYAQVNRKYCSKLNHHFVYSLGMAGVMIRGSLFIGITPKGCARQEPGGVPCQGRSLG